jgi:hypothetical protein
MKTTTKIILGVSALSALAGVAHAQSSASATASSSATIVQPITATKNTDLGFGTILRPASGTATVTVDAAGARTVTGTVAANATGVSASTFTVAGEGGQAYSVGVPSTFPMISGANTLVVTTVSGTGVTGAMSGSAGTVGSASFGVGGTINLNTSTQSGAYTGNFTVTASYN